MSERNHKLYIRDILDSSRKIMDYAKDTSFKDFSKNQMLIDAVVRNLEIIGEASKNIPDEVKQKYPQIDWRKIAGLRDIVVHKYFSIDNEILWDIIKNNIPDLASKIEILLKEEMKK